MSDKLKIVQQNVNKQQIASLQLRDYCSRTAVDVVLIQKPAMCSNKVYGFENCKQVLMDGQAAKTIRVASEYFKYDIPMHCIIEKLRADLDREAGILIGADVNGHSTLWHCPASSNRGL
ncbi:Dimer Tnp hAT domain-containing protein [Aphis craccivora]|uniref:Dimer Tnp hAT domain-containing protein n=1 Tax=Aphis craccivora TaxID=307492 RepID=A0A6G0YME2_APHCR|nr:Dimer Tnp hAT domain-containing protein [Aphis craccivora]